MFPWLEESSPSGWTYARTSRAVIRCVSSRRTIARECFSTAGAAPSSKIVSVPSGWRRASCCQAKRVPGPISKSLRLPPSRQTIAPVRSLIS